MIWSVPSMNRSPEDAWPVRFDSFSFGADCYNTLRCRILYANQHHIPEKYQVGSSGTPRSPDWKDHWNAGFTFLPDDSFPSPVDIKWTAMDGVERRESIDLDAIFPKKVMFHAISREEVDENWLIHSRHPADVLVEVNDRTINVYMRAMVLVKNPPIPERPDVRSRWDLVLAWTKTYD